MGIDLDAAERRGPRPAAGRARRDDAGPPRGGGDTGVRDARRLPDPGFFDLATIYLEAEPPAFGEAATMIEAFRAVLDGVGDRLGEHQPMLDARRSASCR